MATARKPAEPPDPGVVREAALAALVAVAPGREDPPAAWRLPGLRAALRDALLDRLGLGPMLPHGAPAMLEAAAEALLRGPGGTHEAIVAAWAAGRGKKAGRDTDHHGRDAAA